MVGCLKYLGEKKWDIKTFNKIFKSKKRVLCAPPAPPEGLFLARVIYNFFLLLIANFLLIRQRDSALTM